MDSVVIPLELFDDPAFNKLQPGDMKFLLCLYADYHDTERFTIDLQRPEDYRQSSGVWLVHRIKRLTKSGLLQIVGKHMKVHPKGKVWVRVFALKYKWRCIFANNEIIIDY